MIIYISVMVGMSGMSGMLRILGMLRMSKMSGQISSVIPFRNRNLELILIKMGILGMVGISGMSRMTELLIMSGHQVSYLFGTASSS